RRRGAGRGHLHLRRRRGREGSGAGAGGARRRRPGTRRGAARERPGAGRADGGGRQPEPALSRGRRPARGRAGTVSLLPVRGLPEIRAGDDLAALIVEHAALEDGDVVVVAQKVVSKSEGRIVRLDDLEASPKAVELAGDERDPREVEAVLREATRIVRE